MEAAPHSAFVLQSGLAGCVVPDSALSPHFPVFLWLIVSAGSMFDDTLEDTQRKIIAAPAQVLVV